MGTLLITVSLGPRLMEVRSQHKPPGFLHRRRKLWPVLAQQFKALAWKL
jgi:hypothetical protein